MADRPAEALVTGEALRAVILVEGTSDQAALETLAERRGRDLRAEGVTIVPMGGATNVGHFLERYGPPGLGLRVAGLYDAGEERFVGRGLERAGLGSDLCRRDIEALGFFVCVADLEDELIRALGVTLVEEVLEQQGELASFRVLQRQPAQQGRSVQHQLRRFMGSKSGRKGRYARLLVEAMDNWQIPPSLDRALAHL